MSLEDYIRLIRDGFWGSNEELADYLTEKTLDAVRRGGIRELQTKLPQPAPGER